MMKVKQFVMSILTDTKTPLQDMYVDLITLQVGAKYASYKPYTLPGVVELFNCAATFQDKNDLGPLIKLLESVDYGQQTKTILMIKDLDEHLKALRKYNNQKTGEKLSLSNVSIGSFSGMNTFETARLLVANPMEIKVVNRLGNIIEKHGLKIPPIVDYLL